MADGDNQQPDQAAQPEQPKSATDQIEERIGDQNSIWNKLNFWDKGDDASGGGGANGQYVFASFEELQNVINRFKDERDKIREDGEEIRQATQLVEPPAEDMMSRFMGTAAKDSLEQMRNHNKAMLEYAENYIEKLERSLQSMQQNEDANAGDMRNTYQD
ncbi:MAG: hypothetical protein GEU98_20550 [Pseudonocardiaceae bacterium]|nr:hypothetical protein [Pseudonocardiaceae bacterium]